MDDLFAPPDNAWQPVSGQLRRMRRTVLVVAAAVTVVAMLVAFWLAARPFGVPWWVLGLAAAAVLVLTGVGWWLVGRNASFWGYAERDQDLYIKHGAVFRELVAVPYGRMQFVDVAAGPIQQSYGIATVRLHTASPSSNAEIPGLTAAEAARLRDRLADLGETQRAGL